MYLTVCQNYPKESGLREQVIPESGCVLVSCDFSQEELCTLAATLKLRYGKSRMADLINLGVDLHSFFSLYREHKIDDLDLNNIDEELAKVLAERSKPYKEVPELKKSRGLSKVYSFGRGGGMQGHTMYVNCRRQGFKITEEEAQEYCEKWDNTFPEVFRYFDVEQDGWQDETVESIEPAAEEDDDGEVFTSPTFSKGGRKKTYRNCNILGMWRVKSSRNAALNFPFQSLAAVISKRALWLVYLDSLKRGYKLVCFIHE